MAKSVMELLDEYYNINNTTDNSSVIRGIQGDFNKKQTAEDQIAEQLSASTITEKGENLRKNFQYSPDKTLSLTRNTFIEDNEDSYSIHRKYNDSVTEDHLIHSDRNITIQDKFLNPIYNRLSDKNPDDIASIFDTALENEHLGKSEFLREHVKKELDIKKKLLDSGNLSQEERDLVSQDLDTLKIALENPEILNSWNSLSKELLQRYRPDNKELDNTQFIEKLNKLNEEDKQELLNTYHLLDSDISTLKGNTPITYMFSYTGKDGKEYTKIGYADKGGEVKRYLEQHHDNVKLLGIYQGNDAKNVESKLHYLLKKKLGFKSFGSDSSFGSGYTETYEGNLALTNNTDKTYNDVKESLINQQQIQQSIDYAKSIIGRSNATDNVLEFTKNLGKEALVNITRPLLSLVTSVAELGTNNTQLSNPYSTIGQVVNYLYKINKEAEYLTGIDTRIQEKGIEHINEAMHAFEKGYYFKALSSFIQSAVAAPDLLVTSFAYMAGIAMTALPGRAIALGVGASRTVSAITADGIMYGVVAGSEAIRDRIRTNGGTDTLTSSDKAKIYSLNIVNGLIQRSGFEILLPKLNKNNKNSFIDNLIFKSEKDGVSIKELTGKVLDYPSKKKIIGRAIAKWGSIGSLGFVAETIPEYIDSQVEYISKHYNTSMTHGKSLEELLNQNHGDAIVAGLLGGMMGTVVKFPEAHAQLAVAFSDTVYKKLYKEEYYNKALHTYLSSLDPETFNSTVEQLNILADTYTESGNTFENIYNESDLTNKLKHINNLLNNLDTPEYIKTQLTELTSNLMHGIIKDPTFIQYLKTGTHPDESIEIVTNLIHNILDKTTQLLSDVSNESIINKSEFTDAVISKLNSLGFELPLDKITEMSSTELSETITNKLQELKSLGSLDQMYDLITTITELSANSKNEINKQLFKKFNSQLFTAMYNNFIDSKLTNLTSILETNINTSIHNEIIKHAKLVQDTKNILTTIKEKQIKPNGKETTTITKDDVTESINKTLENELNVINTNSNINNKIQENILNNNKLKDKDKNIITNLVKTAQAYLTPKELLNSNILDHLINNDLTTIKNILKNKFITTPGLDQAIKQGIVSEEDIDIVLDDVINALKEAYNESVLNNLNNKIKTTEENALNDANNSLTNLLTQLDKTNDKTILKEFYNKLHSTSTEELENILKALDSPELKNIKVLIKRRLKRDIVKELEQRTIGKIQVDSLKTASKGKGDLSVKDSLKKDNLTVEHFKLILSGLDNDIKRIKYIEDYLDKKENIDPNIKEYLQTELIKLKKDNIKHLESFSILDKLIKLYENNNDNTYDSLIQEYIDLLNEDPELKDDISFINMCVDEIYEKLNNTDEIKKYIKNETNISKLEDKIKGIIRLNLIPPTEEELNEAKKLNEQENICKG